MHKLPSKQAKNAEKQADQIRFFLIQAKEYFDASRTVTLVTRPVLLYYSAMCLATSEILFKQSGDSSLDRARDSHRHHGLVFINERSKRTVDKITQSAAGLRAKPAIRANRERYGTFELWHQTAREAPMVADITSQLQGSNTLGYGAIALSQDSRLGYLPEGGVALLDILKYIPGMARLLSQMGVLPRIVRTHVNQKNIGTASTTSIVIHPGDKNLIDEFLHNIIVNPNDIGNIHYNEFASGGMVITTALSGQSHPRMNYPPCACEAHPEVNFWPTSQYLNEFGFLYVALYIVGNYARYYPDFWIHDVEENTELGLVIEELLNVAERRLALLTLSELSQVYFVPAP